ncbi:uncharacterized protein MAM_01630 [Metarhizium album ARSEF 1941]|uniref:DUF7137 domain-containing protein n=1 Tax=Metarhizium album (strain ARSEF 1941) TaxID=1081103 RepID=A0A0B2WX88_METAS|nr:uncharacterized protein MAM_01630 [Metarhizium album ARSEF 1941]KHO00852.1 hypothetical protein MAM_01630 [Metarhizium album ARSEF 1941]
MRPAQSLVQLALCLSACGSVASASEWPRWLPERDALIVRADGTTDAAQASATEKAASQTTPADAPASTTGPGSSQPADKTTGDSNTVKATPTGKLGTIANGAKKGNSTRTQFPPDAPPAGISIQTPNTNLQPSGLYKISDYITWSWNYTSLLATPSAIDIIVSCSAASETWTLTSNMSFETAVYYVWDSKNQANDVQKPLGVQQYTLIVKDSDASITELPAAGSLGANAQYSFGMYTGQPYTPYADWSCSGMCSAALSASDRQAIGLAILTSVLTFLSFTWFVAGLGLH